MAERDKEDRERANGSALRRMYNDLFLFCFGLFKPLDLVFLYSVDRTVVV